MVVLKSSSHVEHLRTWGGGCDCHESELLQGRVVKCWNKGRRLKKASAKLTYTFQEWSNEAGMARAANFRGDFSLCQDYALAMRAGTAFGKVKTSQFHVLPISIVNLDEPGMRDKLLDEYRSSPEHAHHRETNYFFSESCTEVCPETLLRHVVNMNPDGSGMHPQLQKQLAGLQNGPLDETPAEALHRDVHKLCTTNTGIKRVQVFAKVREAENIQHVNASAETICSRLPHCIATPNSVIDEEWRRYKSVLQPSHKIVKQGSNQGHIVRNPRVMQPVKMIIFLNASVC